MRVHLALAAVAVLFSANYIIAKIGLRSIDAMAFSWLRVAGSAIVMSVIVLARARREPLTRAEKKHALLYAILGVGINQLMFITGLSLTSASEAAILITMIPVFTLLTALVLRTERAGWINAAGMAVAAAGALLILLPNATGGGTNRVVGDIFILINCAAYGIYLVVSRPLFKKRSPIVVLQFLFTAGAVMMLPFCLPALVRMKWAAIPPTAWLALAGAIIGPTVAGYLLSAWALARAESSVVAAYTYLQPFLASLLAMLFLGEQLQAIVLFAAILIITGVALSSWRRPELVSEPETQGLT